MTVHPLLRRAGRVFGWGLLGLVLVLTLALAGGFVFLRSQPGERWIADTVVSALHGAGLDARVGALDGPLPFTLRLRGFQLADAKGVWLDVPEATLRVGPAALLRGHLLVEELSVREPAFLRVPEFPPADPPPPPSDPMEWLRPSFLKPLGSDIAGYLKLATVERLRVEGFRLGQDVMGLPLTATLEGGGPLTDFRNSVDVVLSRPQEGDGPARPLLAVSGSLNLGNAGGWLADAGKDAHPDLAAGLDLRLAVHGAAEPPSSPEEGSLRALLTLTEGRFGVPSLALSAPGATLAATGLSLDGDRIGGGLNAALNDPAALMRLVALFTGGEPVVPPLTSATLDTTLSGTLEAPELALEAAVPGILPDPARKDARLDASASLRFAARALFTEPALSADGTVRLGGPFVAPLLPRKDADAHPGTAEIRLHAEASDTASA